MIEEFRFLIQYEDARRLKFGRNFADLAEIFRRLGQVAPIQNAQHLITYFQESEEITCSLMLTLARYYLGLRDVARARALLQAAPQGAKVGQHLRAEAELLAAQILFLEGKSAKAAETYDRVYRQYSSVNGIAFRCILHSRAIKALVDIPVLTVDRKVVFMNEAASRRERMQLAFLADKGGEDGLRRSLPPGRGPIESLEDGLVDFLKEEAVGGPVRAAAFLQSLQYRFPTNTFEHRYLEFMHGRYREEKRI
jgi:hypothetical protein